MAERTVAPSRFLPVVVNIAAINANLKVVFAGGKRITIWQIWLYNQVAQNIQFFANGRALVGPLGAFPNTSAISLPFTGAPHFELRDGEDFEIGTSAATQLSGFINYLVE